MTKLEKLIKELCIELGFCLPIDMIHLLLDSPPTDVDDFTRTVFIMEGFTPPYNEKLYEQVREKIVEYFS